MIIPSITSCQCEQTKQLGIHVLIIDINFIHKCVILSPVISHTSASLTYKHWLNMTENPLHVI